jgi:hypothetical protein
MSNGFRGKQSYTLSYPVMGNVELIPVKFRAEAIWLQPPSPHFALLYDIYKRASEVSNNGLGI